MPSTYEQEKLAQLTDLIDVFTRKVRPSKVASAVPISHCAEYLLTQQVAHEEQQVEALHDQIKQCKDQVLKWHQL